MNIMTNHNSVTVPKSPPPGLLASMATRYRHDFGLDKDDTSPMESGLSPREREVVLTLMAQLYEEATGQGFYKIL